MGKVILIIVGAIIAVIGILTLFPAITGLWLSIALIAIGIISIILGFLSKSETGVKEVKDFRQEEQTENKIE